MTNTDIEVLQHAAEMMLKRAEAASTGEPWVADVHYDALYTVDLKPSLGFTDGPDSDNYCLKIESCAPYEAPRFLSALHEHADYIASMHPAVGRALAAVLKNEARAAELTDQDAGIIYSPDKRLLRVARIYLGLTV